MYFNIHKKSIELLEQLANSIHDRNPADSQSIFFTISEIQLVKKWLADTLGLDASSEE